jgi:[FeFe] hydrogenase (group B1/B3)
VGAITFGNDQKAYIDKTKCIECGKCASVCPYSAILNYKRPCESSCKVGAITMGESKEARIDYDKCIACGACVSQCPFGAITDRSYILDVIDLLKNAEGGARYRVYALVAPSVAAQSATATVGKILEAIRRLGFTDIREVAEGADLVAREEGGALVERGFLTSSCCPAFVSYVEKFFPSLAVHISPSLSPMGVLAKRIKEADPTAKTVFIGPCTAKKVEFQRKEYEGLIDSVITFTELQALIASRDIEVDTLPEYPLDDASCFGRLLSRSGGLSEAVCEAIRECGADFKPNPIVCSGIEECKPALLRAAKGVLPANFIEGMACRGGCINGAGSLNHSERGRQRAEEYARAATRKGLAEDGEA